MCLAHGRGCRTCHHFPLGPLAALTAPATFDVNGNPTQPPVQHLADTLGVGRETIYRWIRHGIPYYHADTIAVAVGMHPHDVWPDWYEHDLCAQCQRKATTPTNPIKETNAA